MKKGYVCKAKWHNYVTVYLIVYKSRQLREKALGECEPLPIVVLVVIIFIEYLPVRFPSFSLIIDAEITLLFSRQRVKTDKTCYGLHPNKDSCDILTYLHKKRK